MAILTTHKLSEMRGYFRLDAEFWNPEYEQIEKRIRKQNYLSLGDLANDVRKGIFYILASEYTESGVPFYRSSNVGNTLLKQTDLAFISPKKDVEEGKTSLRYGDIVLAKTGKEAAAIVTVDRCNISQDVIGIKLKQSAINPFYLTVFLNSRPGIMQMQRWFQGQVQMHLTLPDARRLLVPIPGKALQESIEKSVKESLKKGETAKALYAQAESVLLEELGLDKLDTSPVLCYERRFSEIRQAGRFDAEYFQPRFQKAFRLLGNQKHTIGDVAKLSKRRFVPKRGVSFQYIEIGDVADCGSIESQEVAGEDAPSRATWIVRPGDVITSTVRPIRRLSALIELSQSGYVCSSGFAVLTPQTVPSELLLVYLRLPLIAEILDLHCSASMYPSISTNDLLHIPFRKPGDAAVEAIKTMVDQSRAARTESRHLLDEAKKMVEKAVLEN